jgi:UDP-N-acetylmuramoyl-tripeptide--D-alanyl-D-alanine ligase
MYELGDGSRSAHREVGRRVATVCNLLVAVGNSDAASLAAAARDAGMAENNVVHAADAIAAADVLKGRLLSGDTVLIKGSRGVGLDRTVDALLEGEAC